MEQKTRQYAREAAWILREKYGGIETAAYAKDLERLARGVPVDYIIGFSDFLGCRIELSEHPLIPRAETEYWADRAFAVVSRMHPRTQLIEMLDPFAGSGCLGIAFLRRFPNAHGTFWDIDKRALAQTKKNIALNNIETEYTVKEADATNPPDGSAFDIILANPPYISPESRFVEHSVHTWEPHVALFADDGGFSVLAQFISRTFALLKTSGSAFIEFDSPQEARIRQAASATGNAYAIWQDQHRKPRVLVLGSAAFTE